MACCLGEWTVTSAVIIEGHNADADDYYQLSPESGLVSPNTLKSSENDGSELSKIYAQNDDNNNHVFSGSEKDDDPSSSSAILSSSTKASEATATQSSTSTNSLPSSNDVAGGAKSEPTESGGEWTDHKSSTEGKPDAKLDALNPRQLLESMRNQSKNTSSSGSNRVSYFNFQGGGGGGQSNRRYNGGEGSRQGRNGSFSSYRGGGENHRSNSASKSRPPNGNQNQYRSNSISSGSKNHFRSKVFFRLAFDGLMVDYTN